MKVVDRIYFDWLTANNVAVGTTELTAQNQIYLPIRNALPEYNKRVVSASFSKESILLYERSLVVFGKAVNKDVND